MIKMSKRLTNLLYVEGDSNLIDEFLENVKERKIKIVYARYPKNMDNINEVTNFINSKWKVAKLDLKKKVIYSRKSSKCAYFAFEDDELQHDLINLVQKFELNAKYKYILRDNKKGIIITEEYKNGLQREAEIITDKLKFENYSVAICLT